MPDILGIVSVTPRKGKEETVAYSDRCPINEEYCVEDIDGYSHWICPHFVGIDTESYTVIVHCNATPNLES